jgi:hypothetical protein
MRTVRAVRLARLLLLLGVLTASVPGASAASMKVTSGALTISGDFTGYATFTIDRPTVLHYVDATIDRSGSYAGALVDSTTVVMESAAWPDGGADMYWNGADRRLRKAGTYRAYLITEPGKYASVSIPWDRPSRALTVSTRASGEYHAERRTMLDTSTPVITLPQLSGGRRDGMWASAIYEANQPLPADVAVSVCITRRTTCAGSALGGANIHGRVSNATLVASGGWDGDARNANVIGYTTTGTAPPATMLDAFTVWSLRLSLNGYVLPYAESYGGRPKTPGSPVPRAVQDSNL